MRPGVGFFPRGVARFQEIPQTLTGAVQPGSDRPVGQAGNLGDGSVVETLLISQHEDSPIGLGQLGGSSGGTQRKSVLSVVAGMKNPTSFGVHGSRMSIARTPALNQETNTSLL